MRRSVEVRGDMSLVGPRPPFVEEAVLPNGFDRVCWGALPGLTWLRQVRGRSDVLVLTPFVGKLMPVGRDAPKQSMVWVIRYRKRVHARKLLATSIEKKTCFTTATRVDTASAEIGVEAYNNDRYSANEFEKISAVRGGMSLVRQRPPFAEESRGVGIVTSPLWIR